MSYTNIMKGTLLLAVILMLNHFHDGYTDAQPKLNDVMMYLLITNHLLIIIMMYILITNHLLIITVS